MENEQVGREGVQKHSVELDNDDLPVFFKLKEQVKTIKTVVWTGGVVSGKLRYLVAWHRRCCTPPTIISWVLLL